MPRMTNIRGIVGSGATTEPNPADHVAIGTSVDATTVQSLRKVACDSIDRPTGGRAIYKRVSCSRSYHNSHRRRTARPDNRKRGHGSCLRIEDANYRTGRCVIAFIRTKFLKSVELGLGGKLRCFVARECITCGSRNICFSRRCGGNEAFGAYISIAKVTRVSIPRTSNGSFAGRGVHEALPKGWQR